MLNIELHGHFEHSGSLELEIFGLFKDMSYIDNIVLTHCNDSVSNAQGVGQPFIRLISDSQHIEEIIDILKILNIDIEYFKLKRFFPAKK